MRLNVFSAAFFLAFVLFLGSPQAYAGCLTPTETRSAVPVAEETAFDDIQDLSGPALISFVRSFTEKASERPDADEAMVFYRTQKGHGADIRVVWFQKGCAFAKATYPAQFWISFMMNARGA
jgi:hypothetical protein